MRGPAPLKLPRDIDAFPDYESIMKFAPDEIVKVQGYLRTKLSNPGLALRARPQAADSAELLLNGEFLGTVYKTVEDGETSYDVTLSVLDIDLE